MFDWLKAQINTAVINSLVRWLMASLGAVLAAKNWLPADTVAQLFGPAGQITGVAIMLAAAIWGAISGMHKADAVAVKNAVAASPLVDAVKTPSGVTVIVPAQTGFTGSLADDLGRG